MNINAFRKAIIQRAADAARKVKGGASVAPPIRSSRVDIADEVADVVKATDAKKVEAVKDLIADRGTGTMLDIPIGVAKALPGIKKLLPEAKYSDLMYAYQHKIVDADHAAGKYLAGKSKTLKKIFTTTDMKPDLVVTTKDNKEVAGYVAKESQRLSAPVDKVKNLVAPILVLGGLTATAGDPNAENKKTAVTRQQVIEKIASIVDNIPIPPTQSILANKVNQAALLLKTADVQIKGLEKLASEYEAEIDSLNQKLASIQRTQAANALTKQMVTKGLIKTAEFNNKLAEITALDTNAFEVLNKTVGSLPKLSAADNTNTPIEKLSFLIIDPYDTAPEGMLTLENAIIQQGRK